MDVVGECEVRVGDEGWVGWELWGEGVRGRGVGVVGGGAEGGFGGRRSAGRVGEGGFGGREGGGKRCG